jgi:hypothetical protein
MGGGRGDMVDDDGSLQTCARDRVAGVVEPLVGLGGTGGQDGGGGEETEETEETEEEGGEMEDEGGEVDEAERDRRRLRKKFGVWSRTYRNLTKLGRLPSKIIEAPLNGASMSTRTSHLTCMQRVALAQVHSRLYICKNIVYVYQFAYHSIL